MKPILHFCPDTQGEGEMEILNALGDTSRTSLAFESRYRPLTASTVTTTLQKAILMSLFFLFTVPVVFKSQGITYALHNEILLFLASVLLVAINLPTVHRFILFLARGRTDICRDPVASVPEPTFTPRISILVPLYKESAVVRDTIANLSALDYPASQREFLLLIEANDYETLSALPSLPDDFRLITIPSSKRRGKPRALNFGMEYLTGQIVTVFDAEDIPERGQLREAASALSCSGNDIWAVQALLRISNTGANWISSIYSAEYAFWHEHYVPFLATAGYPVPLSGTSNYFKADRLRSIGGWDEFNVTEDADIALRIYQHGGKIKMLRSYTMEPAPTKFGNWVRQRSRWIKGLLQTLLVHTRRGLKLKEIAYFTVSIGNAPLVLYLLLLSIVLTVPFEYQQLAIHASAACFIFSWFSTAIIYWSMYTTRSLRPTLLRVLASTILYWCMYLVANSLAIFQLITKPFYWEKTYHGHSGTQRS